MYKYPWHNNLSHVLDTISHKDIFIENKIYFAGGTSIALLHNEQRLSVDLDFMASDGFSTIRELLKTYGASFFFPHMTGGQVMFHREVVRIFHNNIKVDILNTQRYPLYGTMCKYGIPSLHPELLFTEKLMANSDRVHDRSTYCKDLLDIAFLQQCMPSLESFKRGYTIAAEQYKSSIAKDYEAGLKILIDNRNDICKGLKIEKENLINALQTLVQCRKVIRTSTEPQISPSP